MDQQTQEQTSTTIENTENKKPKGGKITTFIALLALLIAIVATLGAAYVWRESQTSQQQAVTQIDTLQTQLSQANQSLDEQKDQLATTQDTLKAFIQHQQQKNDTVLLEVNELVSAAEFHLTFENDINLAHQLLEAADKKIAASQNAALLPLRATFAEDINLLKTTPVVDVAGIVAQLGALSLQAEQLPKIPAAAATGTETEAAATTAGNAEDGSKVTSALEKLKAFTLSVGHALEKLVVVSKDSQLTPALLTADQHQFVITNIQAQLNLAQWAVIHHDTNTYKQSLLQVSHWLQHYFSNKDSLVQNMLQKLAEMQTITITTQTPDISRSLEALKKVKESL